jgi:D-glycerate 3-kinase
MRRRTHLTSVNSFPADFVQRVLESALRSGGKPPVFAIAGLQGSGKSTLAAQLAGAAKARGLRAVALSIDDFYLGRRARQALARRVHPLLATRGPPGTHDAALVCTMLDALRVGTARLPRYDKLGDRRLPPSRWRPIAQPPDLIVFEGWFLKTPPQPAAELVAPLNALERDEDGDGHWRRWCNAALNDYAALWRRIDRLLFLQPPAFDVVPRWRWQQEQALVAAKGQRHGMSRAEVARFVQHFERVSRQALRTLPAIADETIRLDQRRRPLD